MLMSRQFTTHAPSFGRPIDPPVRRIARKPAMRFGDYCDLRFHEICNGGQGGPAYASPVVDAMDPGEIVAALLAS